MKTFNKTLIAVASLACAGVAQAGPLEDVSSLFFNGFQQLSDNSAEYQSVDVNGDELLGVGDVLSGIFTIETIEKTGFTTINLGGSSGNPELTGIFEITVTNYAFFGGQHLFEFGPTASFEATYGIGAMVAMWADSTLDYTRVINDNCTDIASCTATATNGDPFWVLGFTANNNTWTASAVTNDVGSIGSIPAPGNGGFYNAALNVIVNNTDLQFNKVDCITVGNKVDVCGSGSLLGTGGVTTPFSSFDNVDFVVDVSRIPEPATLGLLGLGLIGMGFARRKVATA